MGIYVGDKIVANYYKLPDQTGKAGKALITDGTEANWDDASSVYKYSIDGTYAQKKLVFVDSLDTDVPETSEYSDAIWLYSSPVYPYIPLTTQVSGTSYSFANGGMVICKSPTTVTIGAGELSPIVFTSFVGILPLPAGSSVTTSINSYFSEY